MKHKNQSSSLDKWNIETINNELLNYRSMFVGLH
jgi:hypothetical protein